VAKIPAGSLDMKKTKSLYPTKYYVRLITHLVFSVFIFYYRIKKKLPPEVKRLKSPYLLISNHVGHWDPFIIGHFLPRFTHFVSSDAAFKTKIAGFFLPRLGTIPKKKNVPDSQAVRDIAGVIRQGGNVGIFPEAVRNWAGTTLPIDPSIAKLIKFLKVPVVVSKSQGMNLFNPRWSRHIRKTRVEIEYCLLLDQNQVEKLAPEDIYLSLVSALQHDEVDYQRRERQIIYSNRKAEHISHTLFVCPECRALDSFEASGNDFWCTNCNYTLFIDANGFFQVPNNQQLHFDNIRDWYDWQKDWTFEYIARLSQDHYEGLIFEDKKSRIYASNSGTDLTYVGVANLSLYLDRIEFSFCDQDKVIHIMMDELLTINPQVHEKLEIIYRGGVYRSIGGRPGVSGLKWEIAANAIWKMMGQEQKLSPYIKI